MYERNSPWLDHTQALREDLNHYLEEHYNDLAPWTVERLADAYGAIHALCARLEQM